MMMYYSTVCMVIKRLEFDYEISYYDSNQFFGERFNPQQLSSGRYILHISAVAQSNHFLINYRRVLILQ